MEQEYLPMNSAEVLDRVFETYKRSFGKQLLYSLIVGAIGFGGMFFLGIFGGTMLAYALMTLNTSFIIGASIILSLLLVLFLFWSAAASTGHLLLSKPAFYGKPVALPQGELGKTILRVVSAVIAQLLLSIPFFIIFIALIYVLFSTVLFSPVFDMFVIYPLLAMITFVGAFSIIGLVGGFLYVLYTNFFFLVVSVAVFEKKIFFGSLQRAWELIQGDFWRILGIRTLWFVIIAVITNSAAGILLLSDLFISLFAAGANAGLIYFGISAFMNILSIGIAFVAAPLRGIMPAVIYFNQRIKKEGLGIEIQIERLES